MQTKTIEKNIINKLEDWISSIEDKQLQKDLRGNIIVTGGSIASMFMNEKVNDYDIYIKDIDVLKRLVLYYTSPFGLGIFDGREKDISELDNEDMSKETVAFRNLHEDQIKIYFSDTGGKAVNTDIDFENTAIARNKYIPVFFSPNAISLSDDIQIVCRFSGTPEKIHENFDYIHATNYFTFEEGLVTNKEALESILTKQLRYKGSLYPLTSIIRMRKFLKRGWNINAGEILKMIFQVSLLDLKNPNILEEQLIGVDIAYFGALIEALSNVDPNKLTSPYLNSIIDKIFNNNISEDE